MNNQSSLNNLTTPKSIFTGKSFIGYLLVTCVIMVSLNMRAGIASVGPVLQEVTTDLNMSATLAGIVTAIPCFVFGILGLNAPSFASRFGLHLTMLLAIFSLATGLLLRTFVYSAWLFIILTIIALSGIALVNVLLPAFIRLHFPNHLTSLTAVYSTSIAIATMVAAFVSAPLAKYAPGGWRASLGAWGLLALLAFFIVLLIWSYRLTKPNNNTNNEATKPRNLLQLFKTKKAVMIMLFFGLQSLHAYVQFGWLPQVFRDQGANAQIAGSLLAFLQLINLPGGFIAPLLAARMKHPRILVISFGILLTIGYTGIILSPMSHPWIWIFCIAIASWIFFLNLYLIGTQASSAEKTAQLSGFAQGVGYIIAGFGPLFIGVLNSLTHGWNIPLAFLLVTIPFLVTSGWYSFSKDYVK